MCCKRLRMMVFADHCENVRVLLGFCGMNVIYCRDFGLDCNAKMKGTSVDAVVDATINHGVSMHGQNLKELQTPEKRAEIAAKIKQE